ncbi:MAG: Crp/Fnr family transcriptional regulator [Candidatus Kapaibacterium sp.]|nr:MAG: Crp/Fnr family transcriptional regulator [Candidatus Kapabacteria bacterium]
MSNIWYIENVDMYELLCPHKFADYAAQHVFTCFRKNDPVYMEGDSASKIFLIASGKVKISSMPERAGGEERIKAILGKGELFGEMALFGETERLETATALEETELCPMSVEIMHDLMRDYRTFALGIHKMIGWKLRKIERRMELLLFKDARTRLVEFISDLAKENSKILTDAVLVKHMYTQQNIADLIGIARPTLNLLFNDLRDEGALDFKRGEILLKNRQMFAA